MRRCAERRVESALAPGINALKTFDPPLGALAGRARSPACGGIGKNLVVDVSGDLALLLHLMSAGRLQLFDKRATPRDRTSRLLVRLEDGRELRLREFGTKQAAWVKLLGAAAVEQDEAISQARSRGVARPAAAAPSCWRRRARARCTPCCATSASSPASAARGSTRSSGRARLSPFKRGDDLDEDEADGAARGDRSSASTARSSTTSASSQLPIPDKLPLPLEVHRRHGEPCPRCGDDDRGRPLRGLRALLLPGRSRPAGAVLKDRRLSRLLK